LVVIVGPVRVSDSRVARFGPTTSARATRLADGSVDPTEAGCVEQTEARRRTTKLTCRGGAGSFEPRKAYMPPLSGAAPGSA